MELLLEAPADAGLGLGVGGGGGGDLSGRGGGVEVEELLRLEGELGVARLVVDLHGLDVRRGGAAERARQLRVASLVLRQPVRQTRLAAAPVGRRGVDLRGDLLGRVLLWLRLARHRRHPRLAVAAAGPFLTTLIAFDERSSGRPANYWAPTVSPRGGSRPPSAVGSETCGCDDVGPTPQPRLCVFKDLVSVRDRDKIY
jgi:hypothetical protein